MKIERCLFLQKVIVWSYGEDLILWFTFFIFSCTVKFFFKNVLFQLFTVLGFHSNYRLLIWIPCKYIKFHKKAEYLKNANFVRQKIAIFGVLNVNLTVHDSFLSTFITLSYFVFIYRVLFVLFSSLKKWSQKWEENFNKKYFTFLQLAKKLVYVASKKRICGGSPSAAESS